MSDRSESDGVGFSDTPPSPRLRAGMRIGSYEVLARLERGGMGTLYAARRAGPDGFEPTVALEVVPPHLAENAAFVKMFEREARLAARIAHPNVVHVEELDHEGDLWFQAMELVEGGSLAALLRAIGKADRMLEVSCAVAIACAIADGLHAAHELADDEGGALEIVHRDVRPQHILLSTSGHVKLSGFGVAKARISATRSTTGGLRGKTAYMPPEQAFGRRVDRRADVYALGVVLWEMLTARPLFYASDPLELLARVRAPNVPAPSQLRADLHPVIGEAVMWALAPDARLRPTAQAFRQRLAGLPGIRPIAPDELGQLVRSVLGPSIPAIPSTAAPIETSDEPFDAERALRALTVPTATAATADLRATFQAVELDDSPAPAAISEATPRGRGLAIVVIGAMGVVAFAYLLWYAAGSPDFGGPPAPERVAPDAATPLDRARP